MVTSLETPHFLYLPPSLLCWGKKNQAVNTNEVQIHCCCQGLTALSLVSSCCPIFWALYIQMLYLLVFLYNRFVKKTHTCAGEPDLAQRSHFARHCCLGNDTGRLAMVLKSCSRTYPTAIVHLLQFHSTFIAHTPGHGLDALSSVVLIVAVAGDVLQVVHVGSYQYCPQLHEVAVGRVFHCIWGKINDRAGQSLIISVVMVTNLKIAAEKLGQTRFSPSTMPHGQSLPLTR